MKKYISLPNITIAIVISAAVVNSILFALPAYAQSESQTESQVGTDEAVDSGARQSTERAANDRAPQNARKPEAPEQVFKPTEEISEDLPVPFPVDI